jgi:hypothetical protein
MISCPRRDIFGKEKAMIDERVGKLARVLVDYSTRGGEGDQVLVSAGVHDAG